MGCCGSGNSLVFSNGGIVADSSGYVGWASMASNNNSVLVTGAGSAWTNSASLAVGWFGSGAVTVANGGTVAAATGITIADSDGSTGVLNIGSLGGADSAGTIDAPTIAFGSGNGTINFNQTNSYTATNAISGNGVVNQLGSGTTRLTASNSYTGATTVTNGRLLVDGSAAASTITVTDAGKLGGSGVIGAANIGNGGTLAPGSSIESLETGTLSFTGGSAYAIELDSSAPLSLAADIAIVSGGLNLNGAVTLTLNDIAASPVAFALGTTFSLVNYNGAWNGGLFTYDGTELTNGAVFDAGLNTWEILYDDTTGGENFSGEYLPDSTYVNISIVPEPSTCALFLLGGAASLWCAGRRRCRCIKR